MMDLGPDKVVKTANDLGITADLPKYPSVVLGTGSVSVLDMASAYSTFQNNGTHIEPTSIVRVELSDGTDRTPPDAVRSQALSADQCAKVVYALQKVTEKGGTGAAANFGRPMAGKTGTTQDNKDAWFVGFTPKLTAAVWMGYAVPKEMVQVHGQSVQGGNLPSQVWKKFMMAVADIDVGTFPKPKGDVGAGQLLHPELNTTTTQAPPPTNEPPTTPSTNRPRPNPTWPRPTWPTTTDRPGNGKPPTTPSTPTTRGPGTIPPDD
jgi:membrane peptidoglycan carboxypeptidase